MTGLIVWLIAGAAVAVLGRLFMPGPAAPWLAVLAAGLAGGLLGGAAATLMDMGGIAELDIRSAILASLTAALLVLLLQLLRVLRAKAP